ncbi:Allergen Asp f 7 [Termitomyces sp. T112]|nr:Allergen Asp f 7 [Termitomyces sp. T112]
MRFGAALLSFVLPLAVLGHSPRGSAHTRHYQLAKRAAGEVELHKRFSSARWTFYAVGLGACGKTNVPSDFIVALNSAQFGGGYPGPHCFETITMTYNGKTATATIMDECPGCPFGGLDLSTGLFTFFAPESVGVLYGEWSFNNGAPAPAPAPPKTTTTQEAPPPPPPKTTSTKEQPTTTWKPEPTTTWKPEPTTTWKPEPTTSSSKTKSSSSTHSSSSSSSNFSSSSSSSSSVVSSSAKPSSTLSGSTTSIAPTPSSGSQQPLANLQTVGNVLGAMGEIVLAGVSS